MVPLGFLEAPHGPIAHHFGGSCGTWGTLWGQIGAILVLFSSIFSAKSQENVCIVVSMRLSLFVYCFYKHKS